MSPTTVAKSTSDSAQTQAVVIAPEPPLTAVAKRAQQPLLTQLWSIPALLAQLPLVFPVAADLPPSPKQRYRSRYHYPEALLDPSRLGACSDFEVALRLIDFSPLERELARVYLPSHKGQVPFHPVSMFLALLLRREGNHSWQALARVLAGEHGAGWRALFGFRQGETPCASGLRYFFQAVGPALYEDLCARFVRLLQEHGLFPEHSTYPGDPAERGVSVSQDGQLHPARGRPSCQLATDNCYLPLEPAQPQAAVTASGTIIPMQPTATPAAGAQPPAPLVRGRPCRARERGLEGCACDTPACQEQCRRASRLDPQARFIHYEGHNHKHGQAKGKSKGIDIFGYRSVADRVIDDRFAVAWTARSDLYPANTDERTIFGEGLARLTTGLGDLRLGEWLDDSGVGYGECLEALWEKGILRMVDIRADKADEDFATCLRRGYDGQGRPLCPHGYPLSSNGHDYGRRRTKYVCAQTCRRKPLRQGEAARPVAGCPYLGPAGGLGQVVNVGKTLPDGSLRLAREIPYGSDTWKSRYGRRNLSESRNAQLEGMGMKRLRSYGLGRNRKELQLADFVINLRTLGRLVREATNLTLA